MISPDLLEILRCPLDPSHTRLGLENDRLVCQRCRLTFAASVGHSGDSEALHDSPLAEAAAGQRLRLGEAVAGIVDVPARREPLGESLEIGLA